MSREGKRDAHAVEVHEGDWTAWPPGAYRFVGRAGEPDGAPPIGINYGCPCGCKAVGYLGFSHRDLRPGEGNGWDVTGEWPNVSLTPSIGFYGGSRADKPDGQFHWHGFLTNGVFEEC